MIYDRTCRGSSAFFGLSHSWWMGGHLYRALGRFDAWQGFADWGSALDWLVQLDAPLAEVQFWGHGKWGCAKIADNSLDVGGLEPESALSERLHRLRARMLPNGRSLWWFRTCETFGGEAGHEFAQAWANAFQACVAGHTFIIGVWQSGLHLLTPGARPHWPADEGLKRGTSQKPLEAFGSGPKQINTITCLHGHVPVGF